MSFLKIIPFNFKNMFVVYFNTLAENGKQMEAVSNYCYNRIKLMNGS